MLLYQTYNMQDEMKTCSKDSVPSEIQYYHVLIFKHALRANVYSTKPFGKVLILWWVATNKCMYVKHNPQHNNPSPTSLLITLTVFVAGATNSPIYKHRPEVNLGPACVPDETVYNTTVQPRR